MDAILPHLIWAGVVLYLGHRAEKLAARHRAEADAANAPDLPVEIPEDLLALAMTEQEVWAQEETVRVMRERYEALKDWNKVRIAFGIGQRG